MSDSGALWAQKPGIARARDRLRLGERLMMQAGDTSPVQSPWQGLARLAQGLVGGYEAKGADAEFAAAADADKALMAQLLAPMPGMPQMAPEAPPQAPMTAPLQPVSRLPSGVDPDEDYVVRTVFGEARGEPAQGQQAVAHVIRNRARVAGMPVRDVVLAPGQFEPWGNPQTRAQLEKLDPASPEYQSILQNIRAGAQDPTGGATHFYSPTAQAAAGRPTPAWAQGEGKDIGRHRFYNLPYSAPRGGVPQATGDTIPAQMPAQGGPQTRMGDPASVYQAQAADYQRKAQAAIAGGRTDLAQIFQQQAQMAQQMALSRAPQPDETTRLLMAAGYQPGSPEFQQAARGLLDAKTRGPQTNVTVSGGTSYGTQPPAGWRYVREPTATGGETVRLEEIPGGPAEQARLEKDKKQGQRDEGTARSGSVVTQDIGRILKLMDDANLPTAGMGATFLSNIPGTAASDIKSLVDGIGANIAFDRLQQMRESSPTGAALGAVSDTENRMLMSAYGSLSQSQSPEQFRENLNRLNTIYMDIIHGKGKWQEMRPAPPATGGGSGWSIKPVQ